MPRIRALSLVPLAMFTLLACEAEPLPPTFDNTEYSPEPFQAPPPPFVCAYRVHDPHVSSHQRQRGIIQIVAQVSYGCVSPLPHQHNLTIYVERRNDDGSWKVMSTEACCVDPSVTGSTSREKTVALVASDGRKCIPGTWRVRVVSDTVGADGKPDHQTKLSNERVITESDCT